MGRLFAPLVVVIFVFLLAVPAITIIVVRGQAQADSHAQLIEFMRNARGR